MSSSDQNSYNKSGFFTFLFSMAFSLAVMLYVVLGPAVDLKEVKEQAPEATQTQAAGEKPAQKFDAASVKEPWMPSDQMVAHGRDLFVQNCQMCHGPEGKGDGPAGASLNPKPRNFVEGKWKKGGTRVGLMWVLENGLAGSSMQSYKHLPVIDRWALVHYIRSITKNLVKDDDKEVASKAASLK